MNFLKRLGKEIMDVLPAILYFMIILNFIHFNENLIRDSNDPPYYSYLTVTLSAIIIGKVIIIANYFHLINAFPKKPLIYNIVWKSLMYAIFIFLFRIGENFLHHLIESKKIYLAFEHLKNELLQPIFWCTESWLFLAFLGYIIFSEVTRAVGKQKMMKLFLGQS